LSYFRLLPPGEKHDTGPRYRGKSGKFFLTKPLGAIKVGTNEETDSAAIGRAAVALRGSWFLISSRISTNLTAAGGGVFLYLPSAGR
jgi:hypothetical protein